MHILQKVHGVLFGCLCSCLAFGQSDSIACSASCCGAEDPTPAGVMISHVHAKGEWMFSYRFMHMEMAGIIDGTEKIEAQHVYQAYVMSPHHMRMDMHMLMAMYGISNRFTLMAMGNYNVNSMTMTMMPTAGMDMSHMQGMDMESQHMDMRMYTSGIGDTKLTLLYGLFRSSKHQFVLSGGLSLPTGSIEKKGGEHSMYPGVRFPYAMQLGSGTWDILPGLTYVHQNGGFSWSSQLSGIVRTGSNAVGYQLGNQVTSTTWAAYQWFPCISSSLRVEGTLSEKTFGFDPSLSPTMEPAADPSTYGGRYLNAFLGINFYLRKGLLAGSKWSLEGGIPFYHYSNGPQMTTQTVLWAAYSFKI